MGANWFSRLTANIGQWSNFALDVISLNAWQKVNNNPHPEKEDSEWTNALNQEAKKMHMSDRDVRSIVIADIRGVANTKVNIQSHCGKPHDFDEIVEKLLKKKSHKKHYSYNKKLSRKQSEQNEIRELRLSGGFIVFHHFSTKFNYGHKKELHPLSVIDTTFNNFEAGEYRGIRVNKTTQEITHLRLFYSTNDTKSRWVEYKNMNLFVEHWHDINQYHGVTTLAPVFRGIKYTSAYHTEEMKGAKKRAGTPLIVFDPNYAEQMKILAKEAAKKGKDSEAYRAYNEAIDKGMIHGDVFSPKILPLGAEAKELQGAKDSVYAPLIENQSSSNATASGLSASKLTGKIQSNYTANLIARSNDEESNEDKFELLSEDVWQEDMEYTVDGFVLKGLLPVDAEHYWANREEYHEFTFIRKSKSHVDDLKNEKSITESLSNGTSSKKEQILKKGKDPERVLREELEIKYMKKFLKKEIKAKYGFKKKKKSKINEDDK